MGPEHNANFGNLYTFFMAQLVAILPPGTDLPAAYAGGSDEEQAFVQNLALFLTSFFRVRLDLQSMDSLCATQERRTSDRLRTQQAVAQAQASSRAATRTPRGDVC